MEGVLHHVELYVSNIKKSTEYWGWLLEELGYTVYQKWEQGQSWKKGETYLVFVQAEERFLDVPYHRSRVGLNHLAFHVSTRNRVDEMTEKLRERNIPILYQDKHPFAGGENYYAVFFEDPDRIKVELVAPSK
ncbi:VOC family protein [Sutcliffiella halmapala]|uniref:VOC family protein n=1 Tax=Sutcliffiella halmapala TaxID=79882 RepID=UPI0009955DAE|nr:VOC family protein [Sutcliffiella halmapala]